MKREVCNSWAMKAPFKNVPQRNTRWFYVPIWEYLQTEGPILSFLWVRRVDNGICGGSAGLDGEGDGNMPK